jgi:flagellar assembly protein FliH
MRAIPRTRVKLVRVHKPQPVHVEPVGGQEDSFSPFGGTASAPVGQTASVLAAPDPEEALSDAYDRGVEEGERRADAEFREALERLRIEEDQRISTLLVGMTDQMKVLQRTVEQDAYRFALAVAERIIKREVTLSDDIVILQIKEAMRRIVGVESIKLRVHPSDEAVVHEHRAAFLSSLGNVRDLVIETDEAMERGGCIIESASGNVDARISTQLRQIESSLFGVAPNAEERLP